jgi:hypothetical protein
MRSRAAADVRGLGWSPACPISRLELLAECGEVALTAFRASLVVLRIQGVVAVVTLAGGVVASSPACRFLVEAIVALSVGEKVVSWDSIGLFGLVPGLKQSTIAV